MFNLLKKISISLLAVLLVCSQLLLSTGHSIQTVYANEASTLKIGIKDEIYTKSNRITFDLWARTAQDEKIDNDYVTVTNNGEDVGINWSDEVKTSYTVYLTEGRNDLHIIVDYNGEVLEKDVVIYYEFAEDGEVIGEFTFSMDGFVVGLDYIIDPVKIPIIKGENAAVHLERILADYGFTTNITGSPESGYYLSSIEGGNLSEKEIPEIPEAIIEASYEFGGAEPDPYEYYPDDYGLGEFDFNYMSGWMYAVNNVFPNVGFADYYLMEDDIMRVQFTVAYGSDIGGGYAMGGEGSQYFEHVNKDFLTEIVATINSTSTKDLLLENADIAVAYEEALEALRTVNPTQDDLNTAETNLRDLYNVEKINALNEAIAELPSPEAVTVADRKHIELIRHDLKKLSDAELAEITNIAHLESVETALQGVVATHNQKTAQVVIDAINSLPSVEAAAIEDEQAMLDVVAQYNKLTDEQQPLVSNYETLQAVQAKINALILAASKLAAQPVIDLITALPEKANVTVEHETQINEADAQYQQLSARAKKEVTNYSKLNSVKLSLKTALQNEAKPVTSAITALPKLANLTLSDKENVAAARAKYEALRPSAKQYVTSTNLNNLKKAEDKISELLVADAIAKINALPAVNALTLEDETALTEAQAAFNALTASQQALVTNVETLTTVATQFAQLKADAELAAANALAANEVITLINLLPTVDTLTVEDEAALTDAQTSFDALTADQQNLVINADRLTALANQLAQLKIDAANALVASTVVELINTLPTTEDLTLEDETLLIDAQNAFDALTAEQQAFVSNAYLLTELAAKVEQLKEQAIIAEENAQAANVVIELIDALPAEDALTLEDDAELADVQAAFDALTADQQILVTNATALTQLLDVMKQLKADATTAEENALAAEAVIEKIDNLPAMDDLTLEDETDLIEAQQAFNALTDDQQALVTNADTLLELLDAMAELQAEAAIIAENILAANVVIEKINALPASDAITLIHEEQITDAQAAFDALTADQQNLVTNIDTLLQLEEAINELKAAAAIAEENALAAKAVIEQINALPEVVTSTHITLVEEVQAAFDVLTADQQTLVTNKEKLDKLVEKITAAHNNQLAAEKVDAAINALPTTIILEHAKQIEEARTLFASLTTAQQALVQAFSKLTDAEAQLALLNLVVEEPEVTEPETAQPEANNNNNNSNSNSNRPNDRDDDDDDDESTSSNSSSNSSSSSSSSSSSNSNSSGNTNTSNAGSGGGGAAKPTTPTAPTETPATNVTPSVEAPATNTQTPVPNTQAPATNTNTVPVITTLPAPIKEVAVNTATNTVNIAVEGNTSTVSVALTPEVLATVQEQAGAAVVIQNDNNISVEVPTAVFTDNVANDSEVHFEVQAEPKGKDTKIKFVLQEKRADGTNHNISLGNKYIKVKVPLNLFKQNGPVASLTPIAQDDTGVILRVVDGEYKAAPHQIKDGEVSIYANANNEYVYSTDVVTFADIEHLANKADIEFLASRYVVNGTSETTFEPGKSITRAQFGAMIARALNLTPSTETYYADTKGQWYEADIQALYEAGITNAPGNFNPGETLSREHAAVFMHRVMSYIQKENVPAATATAYADQDQINTSYVEAIATLNNLGIMQGKEGNVFDPKGNLTRAQMAKILRKTLEAIEMM